MILNMCTLLLHISMWIGIVISYCKLYLLIYILGDVSLVCGKFVSTCKSWFFCSLHDWLDGKWTVLVWRSSSLIDHSKWYYSDHGGIRDRTTNLLVCGRPLSHSHPQLGSHRLKWKVLLFWLHAVRLQSSATTTVLCRVNGGSAAWRFVRGCSRGCGGCEKVGILERKQMAHIKSKGPSWLSSMALQRMA